MVVSSHVAAFLIIEEDEWTTVVAGLLNTEADKISADGADVGAIMGRLVVGVSSVREADTSEAGADEAASVGA